MGFEQDLYEAAIFAGFGDETYLGGDGVTRWSSVKDSDYLPLTQETRFPAELRDKEGYVFATVKSLPEARRALFALASAIRAHNQEFNRVQALPLSQFL